jgi:hypothetical protein
MLEFIMAIKNFRFTSEFLVFVVRVLISILRRIRILQNGSQKKRIDKSQGINSVKDHENIEDLAIVISTFQDRFFTYCLPLVQQIRSISKVPIFLVVNGKFVEEDKANEYSDFLREVCSYTRVFPICFNSLNGWASLLNAGIRHSDARNLLIMNDDILIDSALFNDDMRFALAHVSNENLITINNSWSHFIITRQCIRDVGFFDERYLGIGEEDGDYFRRYSSHYGKFPMNENLACFVSINDPSSDNNLSKGIGKYSLFNTCLRRLMYPNVVDGQIAQEISLISKKIGDVDPYPIFKYRERFYSLLEEKDPDVIMLKLRDYF